VSYATPRWIVFWKDALAERRSKEALNALFSSRSSCSSFFQFTLGGDRERLTDALPGSSGSASS